MNDYNAAAGRWTLWPCALSLCILAQCPDDSKPVEEPKPRYKWRKTWPDESDRDSWETDFQGWDGETPVGRIRLETGNLKKGMWQWSGHGPRKLPKGRLLPHQGYEPTARKAAEKAEDYYDRLRKHNDLDH